MSAQIIQGIECPHCFEIIEKRDIEELHDIFICSECKEICETKADAEICCKSEKE